MLRVYKQQGMTYSNSNTSIGKEGILCGDFCLDERWDDLSERSWYSEVTSDRRFYSLEVPGRTRKSSLATDAAKNNRAKQIPIHNEGAGSWLRLPPLRAKIGGQEWNLRLERADITFSSIRGGVHLESLKSSGSECELFQLFPPPCNWKQTPPVKINSSWKDVELVSSATQNMRTSQRPIPVRQTSV